MKSKRHLFPRNVLANFGDYSNYAVVVALLLPVAALLVLLLSWNHYHAKEVEAAEEHRDSLVFEVCTKGWGSDGVQGYESEIMEEAMARPGEGIGHQSFDSTLPPFTLLEIIDKDHVKVRIDSDLVRKNEGFGSEPTREVILAADQSLVAHTQTCDAGETYTLRMTDLKNVPPLVADSPEVVRAISEYAEVEKDERGSIQNIGPPGMGTFGYEIDNTKQERWQSLDATFWQSLAKLNNLRRLSLSSTNVTDEDLRSLENLPRLIQLDLSGTKITDAALPYLAGLKRLETLHLAGTKITDAGLTHLIGLQRLEQLNLSGTAVGDMGVKSLLKLSHLIRLYPNGTQITREGLWELRSTIPDFTDPSTSWRPWGRMRKPHSVIAAEQLARETGDRNPNLLPLLVLGCELSADDNNAILAASIPVPRESGHIGICHTQEQTQRALKLLAGLGVVKAVTLYNPRTEPQSPPLNAETLAMLAELGGMNELNLGNCALTDAAWLEVEKLTQLKKLCVGGATISRKTLRSLQEALPNCAIVGRSS